MFPPESVRSISLFALSSASTCPSNASVHYCNPLTSLFSNCLQHLLPQVLNSISQVLTLSALLQDCVAIRCDSQQVCCMHSSITEATGRCWTHSVLVTGDDVKFGERGVHNGRFVFCLISKYLPKKTNDMLFSLAYDRFLQHVNELQLLQLIHSCRTFRIECAALFDNHISDKR